MKAVWPTSVVEENNLNQQISALRRMFGEAPNDHRFIVPVMGRGFRFVQDVRPVASLPSPVARSRRWREFRPVLAAALVLLLMAGAAFVLLEGREPQRAAATPETQSIAVILFADVSPAEDQAYFVVDGLSEELLNALGKLEGLRIIGRTSSFSFRGRDDDARGVGAALGVRHVLEGSVRRDGDRLRITARLVDAGDGAQLWRTPTIARSATCSRSRRRSPVLWRPLSELALRPTRATSAGATQNFEAYDAYLAARAVMNTGGTPRAREAIALLERAVDVDPDFALAWASLAEAYTYAADFPGASALPLTALEVQQRVSRAALRAFELAPTRPRRCAPPGWSRCRTAIGPGPSGGCVGPWGRRAVRLRRELPLRVVPTNVGRASEAIVYEERAMRAEPLLMRPEFLAALHEMRGDLDEASAALIERAPYGTRADAQRGPLHDRPRASGPRRPAAPHARHAPIRRTRCSTTRRSRSRSCASVTPMPRLAARAPVSVGGDLPRSWDEEPRSTRCAKLGADRRTCMCSGAGRCARCASNSPGFAGLVQDLGLADTGARVGIGASSAARRQAAIRLCS